MNNADLPVPCDGTFLGPAVAGGYGFDGLAQTTQVHPSAPQIHTLLSEIGPNGFRIITHTAGVNPNIAVEYKTVKPESTCGEALSLLAET